jgi:hypothetical protein
MKLYGAVESCQFLGVCRLRTSRYLFSFYSGRGNTSLSESLRVLVRINMLLNGGYLVFQDTL